MKIFSALLFVFLHFFGTTKANQDHLMLNDIHGEKEGYEKETINSSPISSEGIISSNNNLSSFILPTADKNYNLISIPLKKGIKNVEEMMSLPITDVERNIEYYDGLGRPIQSIAIQGTPLMQDLTQLYAYDRYGRNNRDFLPYVDNTSSGEYKLNAIDSHKAFYITPLPNITTNPHPYFDTEYENSPLGRFKERGFPGSYWKIGDNSFLKNYTTNELTEYNNIPNYQAALYKVGKNIDGSNSLIRGSGNGRYFKSQLFLTLLQDENKLSFIEEYRDKEGKLILERKHTESSFASQEILSTYYVYDIYGNLCYVLPPIVNADSPGNIPQQVLNNYCYQYVYDQRNRLIRKKLPGKGWEFLIYNNAGKIILIQDANQRNKSPQQWTFMKYDASGREIVLGVYQDIQSIVDGNVNSPSINRQTALQSEVDQTNNLWEDRTAIGTGYSNITFPTTGILKYLIFSYYDDYDIPGLPVQYNAAATHSNLIDGFLTARRIAVLNHPSNMLWSVNYYNDRGNVETTFTQHYKGGVVSDGNYDKWNATYNFSNQILNEYTEHKIGNVNEVKVINRYVYDHSGRLLDGFVKINNTDSVLLLRNFYNEIGQLAEKSLHSDDNGYSFLQSISYNYHQRGWLKKANSELFNFELLYEDPNEGSIEYNGNISGFRWGEDLENVFDYYYDGTGRLLKGNLYGTSIDETISYDKGGNIRTLSRDGVLKTYNYNYQGNEGNLLSSVTGSITSSPYVYDLNGNMITDGIRSLSIGYNILNLPETITGDGQSIVYTYDATGRMLRKESATTGVSEYIGAIQYIGNDISFIKTGVGRAVKNGNRYIFRYDLTDHLGNSRITFDKDPITGNARRLQEDYYYPFGKRISVSPISLENEYLYNGKEIQEELGVYDYGARFYDADLGKWTVIDPLSELTYSYSPYSYVYNSPINHIDPNGMIGVGTLSGALIAGGIKAIQGAGWKDIGKAALAGAIGGAVFDLAIYSGGTSVGVMLAAGAMSGMAQEATISALYGNKINGSELAKAGLWGMAGSAFGVALPNVGKIVRGMFKKPLISVGEATDNVVTETGKIISKEGLISPGFIDDASKTSTNLLSSGELLRIENAATRIGKPITVVGSRATPGRVSNGVNTLTGKMADWDYVIPGLNSKNWSTIKNSLPGSRSILDNTPRNIDILPGPVWPGSPHITIYPR